MLIYMHEYLHHTSHYELISNHVQQVNIVCAQCTPLCVPLHR